ncbi:hypothetical protein, partial [Pantoea sp. GbtcB22]|uniref:hypothetical protein n=1 Tax=Pantoea sp. GbtcB22 TaxID=2824767 RepID=UPI001C2F8E22
HVLYLGPGRLLNVKNEAEITLDVSLSQSAKTPLALTWEFWTKDDADPQDEDHWQELPILLDGTAGFMTSGRIRLLKPG